MAVDQIQQQMSASLANQAVQDNARREQAGGKKKPLIANLFLFQPEFEALASLLGNIHGSANWTKELSVPGISAHLSMKDTLIHESKIARRDLSWLLDEMKQYKKEDPILQEAQTKQKDDSEREQIRHKSFEDPNRQYHEQNRSHAQQEQHHQPGQHDDSNRNFWRNIQMASNQNRMNITNKNDDAYNMAHQWLNQERHWVQEAQGQQRIFQEIHRHSMSRKQKQSHVI